MRDENEKESCDCAVDADGLKVYLCARVSAYRELARGLAGPEDVVIEVGAAEGHTTGYLARRARRVIAVEKAAQCMQRARERCRAQDNIDWLEVDAHDLDAVRKAVPDGGVDLVFIDIGGSTRQWLALKLAGMYRQMFRPRVLVRPA